jgi:hypothetical protein
MNFQQISYVALNQQRTLQTGGSSRCAIPTPRAYYAEIAGYKIG